MADGFSLNIDDKFLRTLEKADTQMAKLAQTSEDTSKRMMQAISDVNNNALKPFIENLNSIRKSLNAKSQPIFFKEINTQASQSIDKINSFISLMDKINNVNANSTRNSAITKINEELEGAKKRLSELQSLLNFYTKGDGKKAIGFVDTSAQQAEARSLMNRIDALTREREHLQANARLRMEIAKRQEQIDNSWMSMEQAKISLLKEEASITNALVKSRSSNIIRQREEQQRMYEKMFDEAISKQYAKMWDDAEKMLANKQKIERENYEIWLRQKAKEVEEHKLAEERKTQATREAIKQQLQAMSINANRDREQVETQRKREQEATQRINQQIQARYTYTSEVEKMYAKMFDKIAEREKAKQEEARRYEYSLYEQSLAKYRKMKQDQSNVDKHYHDLRQKQYDDMFRAIERNEKRQQQINKKYGDSSQGALNYFDRLGSGFKSRSLNNMQTALSKLQDAQSRLNLSTEHGVKRYAELEKRIQYLQRSINATTNSINNMNKAHRGLMDTSAQLARKLALVFSVSQIQGYIGKLIQVRGEFELQQKSLQVLLQSKDEADKLWQQTIDLAVRSPFRVKELVGYTRQLAAYRIETEKLHDTTRRLSDVSAGLGVDMQRIILAFGQVRAANFLRGTELRQFTEAGIPMLDELAKYFTELEGRMVSAGDVFERISKRMVSFADVEEVFHRMTDAGGVFYKMQEEQSKTLKGMISNLHDSIDLMLNDIGKANDGLLKGGVNAAKTFVENWREAAFYIEQVVIQLAAWKVANAAYIIGTRNAATATLWGNAALKSNIGTSMNMIKMLKWSETSMLGVTKTQYLMGKATLYLQGTLRGVGMAMKSFLPLAAIAAISVGLTELYRRLTKSSREAKVLANSLSEIYNEDTSSLEKQTMTFKDLVERLKNVNKGSKEHKNIISQLNSQYGDYLGFLITEKTTYDEIATSIDSVIEALNQKAKAQTFEKALSKIIEDSSKKISSLQDDLESKISKIGVYREGEKPALMPTEAELNDIFNLYEKKVKEANDLVFVGDVFSDYYGENLQVAANISDIFASIGREILKQKREEEKLQSKINGLYGESTYSTLEMRNAMKELNSEREKALASEKTRIGREKIEYDYLVKKTKLDGKYQNLAPEVIDANVAKLQKTSETIQDINRRIIESTDELGAEAVDRVYITAQDASQGTSQIAENMAAAYKSMQETIKQENALKAAGTVHDQKSLDNAEMMSKAYYKVLEIMGRLDLLEAKGNKKESAIKILNNRISLIKEINKEYEKLNEKFDSTTAKEQVLNAYKDTFKDAFEGTGIKFSGLVIDKEKLKIEGEKSGQIFSDEMVKKMNDVIASGTYIRSASDRFKDELKKDEGVVFQLYDDSTKKIINNTKEFQNAVGTVTIGWGHAIKDINEAAKYFGKTISEIEAQEIFDQDVDAHVQALNKVLNKYQDLILTQEQYDSLLNATFQGGGGMVSSAINYAMDIDKGIKHFDNLEIKLKKVGKTFEQEFGSDFIDRFKNAETATERLALALETVGLTTVASGGNIDERLYDGMKKRSLERAKEFRGDLELVKLLHKAAVDVSQIDFTNIRGVIATLKQLEPIAKKEGKEAQLALSKAISQLEAEVNLNVKAKEDKQLIDDIEKMFSGYEMSIELDKLNIPPGLAKQLFNVDSVDLSSIRNKIESELSKAQKVGGQEDRVKELKKQLDKVEEMEDKAMQERLKKYVKYLTQAQGERVKIKMEEIRKLNEIETLNFNESQKSMARMAIQEEAKQKMDKLDWEEFKDSGMYVQLFEDLEFASTKALTKMRERLISLKEQLSDLDADDLRNLYNQIEKLDEQLAKRNSYKTAILGINDYVKALKESKRIELELDKEGAITRGLKRSEADLSSELSIEQSKYKQMLANFKVSGDEVNKQYRKVQTLESQLALIKAQLIAQGKLTKELERQLSGAKNTRKTFEGSWSEVGSDISAAANALPQIAGDLENVFGTMSDGAKDIIDSISTIGSGVGDAIQGFASQNYIQAISGIAKALGGVFAIGDKDKERQIQREIKFVEDLERAYAKLEKAIDGAYSINTLQSSGKAAKDNLEAQIASYKKMIAAEEDKKKTDQDRINEWQLAIEDLIEQKAELDKQLVSTATGGIMDDVLSAAQEFTNAWLEAFNETGDGLSGLEDNFKETMLEMVKQQASMLISSSYIENWKKQLEQYINPDDLDLSTDEAKKWVNAVTTSLPQLNQALENYFTAMQQAGVDLGGGTSGELSGLQRGIQGVTEETAQIIEAYLNSIRFFVAEQTTFLSQIASSFGNNEIENPMVGQLRIIAAQTSAINSLLQGLVRGGHSLGGSGLKVFIS